MALTACDTGLQGKLNEARDRRYEAAKKAVYKVEDERLATLEKNLPKPDAEFVGDEHPLLVWRKKLLDRTDDKTLTELATHAKPTEQMTEKEGLNIGAKGTPAQTAAELAAAYIKEQAAYWTHNSTMSRYKLYLHQFFDAVNAAKKAAEDRQAAMAKNPEFVEDAKAEAFVPPPLLDEAHFDQVFMHAVKYFNLSKLVDRSQSYASTMADYEIAFEFPGRGFGKESFSDYVSRICFMHEGLKERCNGVPHEYRAGIIDRAYLEWLLQQSKALQLSPKAKVLSDVNARIGEAIDATLKQPFNTKEEPVFPSTYAEVSGMSGIEALFSDEQGVLFNGVKLADKFGGQLPTGFVDTIKKAIEVNKNQPGNRVDYQRVVLRMPGNVPFGTVISTIKSFPADTIKQVFLVGRRRVDESMRLAALPMRLPRPDDNQTLSFQFKDEAAKTTCNFLGVLGDPMVGKHDEFYLQIAGDKVRATQVTTPDPDPANPTKPLDKIPGDTVDLGSPKDLTKTLEFIDAHAKARFRTFIGSKYSYDEALQLVSQLLYTCKDEELVYNDPQKKPLIRKCGKVTSREMTLILGVCE
ncbi:MAG: hypothetical protein U1F43_24175 [Myxococcota bacterium]